MAAMSGDFYTRELMAASRAELERLLSFLQKLGKPKPAIVGGWAVYAYVGGWDRGT